MNFYLNGSDIGIFVSILLIIISAVIIMGGILIFVIYLVQWLKLNKILSAITIVIFLAVGTLLSVFVPASVTGYYSLGEIRTIYFVSNQNQQRMAVLFHQSSSKVFKHDYRLLSYDFHTGKEKGRVTLTPRGYNDKRYYLFEPFRNNTIWGYNFETGFQLIDIFNAKIIADEEGILRKNPKLGGIFRPYWDDVFDERSNSIRVITNDGDIFTISPELNATNLREKETKKTGSASSSHKK